jgi:hypothetical protein
MKKLLPLALLTGLVFGLTGCVLEEVSLLYSCDEWNGFTIGVNKAASSCFVGAYTSTDYIENQEITIPDEYENKPITRIGGYYGRGVPTPFSISLEKDAYMNAPEGSAYHAVYVGNIPDYHITDAHSVEDLVFTLNIGKNIKSIDYVIMDTNYPHVNEDGSVTFYHPVVHINCSEENARFYSKDGKLYNKKTDELISVFAYASE